MSRILAGVAAGFFCLTAAQAHHSVTHFSPDFTEMEGTLVDLKWRNPHVYFYLEVEEDGGSTRVWEMEAGTIYMIGRAGVTRDMFTIGERVRVAGNRSTVYEDKFWLTNVLLSDGREVLVVARGEPRWANELIGGKNQWSDTALHDDNTNDADQGIFRVWSPPGPGADIVVERDPEQRPLAEIATAASLAVQETWDPYAFDEACERAGVPRVNFGPHPHQFIEDGEDILLLSEEFDLTRRFHMNSDLDPADQPLSKLGVSVGRWQDERTLVVETSRVNFPYMNLGGYGQSEQTRMTEVYTLSEDETQLAYKVTITDPVMLTAPYIQTGVWVDLGEGMVGYDCVPSVTSE
jgi:hypothetical protein